jgi:hypothetical protein
VERKDSPACGTCKHRESLLSVCKAAIAYDAAIQRYAEKGQSWVDGDDLDTLYEDWITKAREAIADAEAEVSHA